MHDADVKLGSVPSTPASIPKPPTAAQAAPSPRLPPPSLQVQPAPEPDEPVCAIPNVSHSLLLTFFFQTVKVTQDTTTPAGGRTPTQGSTGYAAGNRSLGRGDLDEAIRSMRTAKRRQRVARPVSKIFLDGASHNSRPASRLFD